LGCFVVGFWIFWVCFCNFVVAVHFFHFCCPYVKKSSQPWFCCSCFQALARYGKGGGRRGGERRKEETGGGGRYGYHALL
jgi:hypothetical protein